MVQTRHLERTEHILLCKNKSAVLAAPKMTRLRGFVALLPMLVGDAKAGSRGCDILYLTHHRERKRMTLDFTAFTFCVLMTHIRILLLFVPTGSGGGFVIF